MKKRQVRMETVWYYLTANASRFSARSLCFIALLGSSAIGLADQRIVINNDSACDLKLIYSDVAASIHHHMATGYIRKHSSGVVVANVDMAATHEEIFIDDYLALCGEKTVDLYIVGRNAFYGWVASLEHNSLITLRNANYYNYFGQTITATYQDDNHVDVSSY